MAVAVRRYIDKQDREKFAKELQIDRNTTLKNRSIDTQDLEAVTKLLQVKAAIVPLSVKIDGNDIGKKLRDIQSAP